MSTGRFLHQRKRKRSKYILYRSLVPKFRYLRATHQPNILYQLTISPIDLVTGATDSFFPGGWISFAVNTVENVLAFAPIKGYNVLFVAAPSVLGQISDMETALVTVPLAVTTVTEANVVEGGADSFTFRRGIGTDQVSEHYKLYFVEKKKIVMEMTQRPSFDGPAGADRVMPGFTMYSRLLNQIEMNNADSLFEDLAPYAPDSSVATDQHVRSKQYRELSTGFGTSGYTMKNRNFTWSSTFRTQSAHSNTEIDTLVGTITQDRQDAVFPVPHILPSKFVFGQIGWLMDHAGPLNPGAGDDDPALQKLEFFVKFKVITDTIYFNRDELYTESTVFED